jgi:hypothetical protein
MLHCRDGCPLNLAKGTTVLFVADPGECFFYAQHTLCCISRTTHPKDQTRCCSHSTVGGFSGTAEAAFYLNNLQHKVEIPKGAAACADGFTGIIMEQPVAVFTTGAPTTR